MYTLYYDIYIYGIFLKIVYYTLRDYKKNEKRSL